MFIGRSTHDLAEEFAKLEKRPKDIDARKREFILMAELLKETIGTRGWKEIIEPFLRKHGNPAQMFKIMRENQEVSKILGAKVEAYHNFLNLVYNIVGLIKSEDKKAETEEEEESEEEDQPL